jgi:hypothetical protein
MTLVKRENLYKYLVMIVHPDRNPNDPLATKKTQDVNFNKNNPDVLIALAKVWGLPIAIEGDSPYTSTPDPRRNTTTRNPFEGTSNTGRSNFDNFRDMFNQRVRENSTNRFKPSVQDVIFIRSLGKCYVVSIEPITSGKFSGGTKYHIFSTLKNTFYQYKTTSGVIAGVDNRMGTFPMSELTRLNEMFLEQYGRRLNKNGVRPIDIKTQFSKVGLEQYRNYNGSKKVRIVGWSGVYDVIKTTEKCVYINYCGTSTRKSIDKVRAV